MNGDPWLFSAGGRPISIRTVQRWVRQAAADAGIQDRIHPHLYRHTKAFNVASERGLFAAQQKLGHVNVQSTLKYLRLNVQNFLEIVGEK